VRDTCLLPASQRSRRGSRPSAFRRSGLPVRLIRSKRGWMLSCVRDRGWVVPLLSALLSAAGSTGSRGMLTAMPADLPCRRARNGYGRCSLAPRRCCLRNSLGSQKPTGSASHVCPIGTESVTHEPFGAGGAEPTTPSWAIRRSADDVGPCPAAVSPVTLSGGVVSAIKEFGGSRREGGGRDAEDP